MENESWNEWIFKMNWNKIEWVNQRNISEGKNPFCVSSKKFHLKDNNKTSHWVGHSKLKILALEDLYNIKIIINKLEASLTVTTIEKFDYGMKKNPDASVVADVENSDAFLTADASKINEEYENMNLSEKEDQNTVVYQETLKIDVKNINKKLIKHGDQYIKLSMLHFSKKLTFSHKSF